MIQAKFGLAAVAERQLETFSTAVLLATESPPKPPRYHSSALMHCPARASLFCPDAVDCIISPGFNSVRMCANFPLVLSRASVCQFCPGIVLCMSTPDTVLCMSMPCMVDMFLWPTRKRGLGLQLADQPSLCLHLHVNTSPCMIA